MKWFLFVAFAVLAAVPVAASAQEVIPIGHIARIDNPAPTWWAMSGWFMVHIVRSDSDFTPIMRSETYDARTVEILSRTQAPPLRGSDVHVVSRNGRDFVVVRRYLLMEVKPQDAQAAAMSKHALAERWASAVRRVLPRVAPLPSPYGI